MTLSKRGGETGRDYSAVGADVVGYGLGCLGFVGMVFVDEVEEGRWILRAVDEVVGAIGALVDGEDYFFDRSCGFCVRDRCDRYSEMLGEMMRCCEICLGFMVRGLLL